jgi:segregation and condensation protein B
MKLLRELEALLFVADSPARPEDLATAIGAPLYEVEEALEKLGGRYFHNTALQLVRIAGGYQLCTKPEYAAAVTRFLQPKKQKLSRSLLEVLAVVAYQQPVTVAEIDTIRGVSSDYAVKQLVEKRFIAEVGRKPTAGRPILYGTTPQFLHSFHMNSVSELPQLSAAATATVGHQQAPEQPQLPSVAEEVDAS